MPRTRVPQFAGPIMVLLAGACAPVGHIAGTGAPERSGDVERPQALTASNERTFVLTLRRVHVDEQWKVEIRATLQNRSDEPLWVNVAYARSLLLRGLSLRTEGDDLLYRFAVCPDNDVISKSEIKRMAPQQELELEAVFNLGPGEHFGAGLYCAYRYATTGSGGTDKCEIDPTSIPNGAYVADMHLPIFSYAQADGVSGSNNIRDQVQIAVALNRVWVEIAARDVNGNRELKAGANP